MKAKIEMLARLQSAEKQIRGIEQALELAPRRFESLSQEREALEAAVADADGELKALNRRYRELEREARAQEDRAAKRAARLHEVKTNKEYQATLKEIDDIRTGASAIEDEMIGLLDEIEATEARLSERREIAGRREAELRIEAAEIEAGMARDQERLLAAKAACEAAAGQIEGEMLAIYRHAQAQQKDRVAVAGVQHAVCQGCHMNIPPQLYNELQRQDSIKICPLCQRIIYWLNEEA